MRRADGWYLTPIIVQRTIIYSSLKTAKQCQQAATSAGCASSLLSVQPVCLQLVWLQQDRWKERVCMCVCLCVCVTWKLPKVTLFQPSLSVCCRVMLTHTHTYTLSTISAEVAPLLCLTLVSLPPVSPSVINFWRMLAKYLNLIARGFAYEQSCF